MGSERVVIIGAGPAGMGAARGAKNKGHRVTVIDENPWPGGRVYRWLDPRLGQGLEMLLRERVVGLDPERRTVRLVAREIEYDRLILACGAREILLPFPGWTLPHVVGVGGLQALAKDGLSVRGKRIVVCGSGPLLLAVASNLAVLGARIELVAEQASWGSMLSFGAKLWRWPDRLWEAFAYRRASYRAGRWPVRAMEGAVEMNDGARIACDWLACGWGLAPNNELAQLASCAMDGGFVLVDRFGATSVEAVYAVGEMTGIGGVHKAAVEGYAAGAGIELTTDTKQWATVLARHFALRPEVLELAQAETVVCRCEDVTLGQLRRATSWRDAKLQTRCGMGPCQGRVCGPAVERLCGWRMESVREPVTPMRVADWVD